MFGEAASRVDCFVIDTAGGQAAVELTQRLRLAGVATDRAYDGRRMKSQMKSAAKSGARLAAIVGEDEAAAGTVTVRDLDAGQQTSIAAPDVVDHIRKVLDQ